MNAVMTVRGAARAQIDSEVAEYFELGVRLDRGATVFDVGANIGAFTSACVRRTDGPIVVHAFEPSPRTFQKLVTTVDTEGLNAGARRVVLHCMALGDGSAPDAMRPFYHFKRFPTDSTYDIEGKRREVAAYCRARLLRAEQMLGWAPTPLSRVLGSMRSFVSVDSLVCIWLADRVMGTERTECRTASLDSVAEQHQVGRIDLLKIDVEGAEGDVLAGADRTLGRVSQAVLETIDDHARDVIARLESHGLRARRTTRPRATADGLKNVLIYAEREALAAE